jgi:hypothetical protein
MLNAESLSLFWRKKTRLEAEDLHDFYLKSPEMLFAML